MIKNLLLLLAFSLFFTSCQSISTKSSETDNVNLSLSDAQKIFEESNIYFRFENISHSYWNIDNSDGSMFFNCFVIDYSKKLIQKGIKELAFYDPSNYSWDYEPLFSNNKIWKWSNFYTSTYSYDGSLLLLGDYTLELTFNDNTKISRIVNVSEFIDNSGTIYNAIYSSDYTGLKRKDYLESLNRASLLQAKKSTNDISILFSVKDKRAVNGSITLYDEDRNRVADTIVFYSSYSSQNIPYLNNGESIRNEGAENTIELPNADIIFNSGKSISDVKKVIITLFNKKDLDQKQDDNVFVLLTSVSELTDIMDK